MTSDFSFLCLWIGLPWMWEKISCGHDYNLPETWKVHCRSPSMFFHSSSEGFGKGKEERQKCAVLTGKQPKHCGLGKKTLWLEAGHDMSFTCEYDSQKQFWVFLDISSYEWTVEGLCIPQDAIISDTSDDYHWSFYKQERYSKCKNTKTQQHKCTDVSKQ